MCKRNLTLHVFKKNIGNLESGVTVWVGEVRSYMEWSRRKVCFYRGVDSNRELGKRPSCYEFSG